MAQYDRYLQSVPKIPFVNVTNQTIPPFGVICLYKLTKHGFFEAIQHAHSHSALGDHEPDEVFPSVGGSTPGVNITAPYSQDANPTTGLLNIQVSTEWAAAFNLGNSVEPNKKGLCYQSLPAIAPLYDPNREIEGSPTLKYGDVLAVHQNSFKLTAVRGTLFDITRANGWIFMSHIPSVTELVMVGGIISFQSPDVSY